MKFDLTTPDNAYDFLLKFLQMSGEEYIEELIINSQNDFETFWNRNINRIDAIDISYIKLIAYHVIGSLDDCEEIKKNGLMNLQQVLVGDTCLNRTLKDYNLCFDIENKVMHYNGKEYCIDYEYYRNKDSLTYTEDKLKWIAHRIYYDYCINGFMVNDDVYSYGTDIHIRPEFILKLVNAFPKLENMERTWIETSKSYKVTFYATLDQIHRFNFDLDNYIDPPFENWFELSDTQKIKKWMLSYAIMRANDDLGETFMYIRDEVEIYANQIISCEEISKINLNSVRELNE